MVEALTVVAQSSGPLPPATRSFSIPDSSPILILWANDRTLTHMVVVQDHIPHGSSGGAGGCSPKKHFLQIEASFKHLT